MLKFNFEETQSSTVELTGKSQYSTAKQAETDADKDLHRSVGDMTLYSMCTLTLRIPVADDFVLQVITYDRLGFGTSCSWQLARPCTPLSILSPHTGSSYGPRAMVIAWYSILLVTFY